MAFNPRRLSNGRVCCSDVSVLCAECMAHFDLTPNEQDRVLHQTLSWLRAAASRSDDRDSIGQRIGREIGQFVQSYQPDPPPDPYASGRAKVLDVTPGLDPNYQPRGVAPDGYAIAIEIARLKKEQK